MSKRMSKPLLIMLGGLSLATLSGCGASGEESSDVISIAIVSDTAEETTINTFIRGFRALPENSNVRFKIEKYNEYNNNISKAFLYDELPDIIQVYDYNCEYYTNEDLSGNGTSLLQPISSLMDRDGIKEGAFFPSIVEMTKCHNQNNDMYWLPRDYNKVVCAYNKDMFDLAEIEYPSEGWTWSEFLATLEALKSKEAIIKSQYSHSAAFYPVDLNLTFPAVYYPILKSYGAELIDKETDTCFGNTEAAVDKAKGAWGKLLSLVDSKLAAPIAQKIPFTNKQAAMMFIVRPNLPTYVKGLGDDAIDFVSLPTYDDLPSGATSYIGMGCSGYGITTSCPDSRKETAWSFLKYIVSEEGQNAFSEAGSGIPSLKSLALDENASFKKYKVTDDYHPNHDAFVANADRDIPMNFMRGFHTDKQLSIDKYIKDRTLNSFVTSTDRDAYYQTYKTEMEKIWKK